MRVGILDLIALPSKSIRKKVNQLAISKQYTSIAPQILATWSRQLGHEVYYATYYGVGRPEKKLPCNLDMVLISSFTQSSAIAYALANYYSRLGATTVLGGAHAKAFPVDALRHFDIVVKECDKILLKRILQDEFEPGSYISTDNALTGVPSVEERMPDILATAFFWKKSKTFLTSIPMLMSTGCPYDCGFCSEWNRPYKQFSNEQLVEDLKYVSQNYPDVMLQFQDPNFAIKFDEIMSSMEQISPESRPRYITQSSLSVLKSITRMQRLRDTNCAAIAPGIESWTDYSRKAAAGSSSGKQKVSQVAGHLKALSDFVPYGQANMIFGLDTDMGDEPIELSKEFFDLIPFFWSTINIPVPFGGTPMFDQHHAEGRVLRNMPFLFYLNPYLVVKLKHYHPMEFYKQLISLVDHVTNSKMLRQRMRSSKDVRVKTLHWLRTIYARSQLDYQKGILKRMQQDSEFLAFHEGRSNKLPGYYQKKYDSLLGDYASLLKPGDRYPDFTQMDPVMVN